jgi:hypothetical protein
MRKPRDDSVVAGLARPGASVTTADRPLTRYRGQRCTSQLNSHGNMRSGAPSSKPKPPQRSKQQARRSIAHPDVVELMKCASFHCLWLPPLAAKCLLLTGDKLLATRKQPQERYLLTHAHFLDPFLESITIWYAGGADPAVRRLMNDPAGHRGDGAPGKRLQVDEVRIEFCVVDSSPSVDNRDALQVSTHPAILRRGSRCDEAQGGPRLLKEFVRSDRLINCTDKCDPVVVGLG